MGCDTLSLRGESRCPSSPMWCRCCRCTASPAKAHSAGKTAASAPQSMRIFVYFPPFCISSSHSLCQRRFLRTLLHRYLQCSNGPHRWSWSQSACHWAHPLSGRSIEQNAHAMVIRDNTAIIGFGLAALPFTLLLGLSFALPMVLPIILPILLSSIGLTFISALVLALPFGVLAAVLAFSMSPWWSGWSPRPSHLTT